MARNSNSSLSPNAKLAPSEHSLQVAFFDWCKLNEGRYPGLRWTFSVPNSAKRSYRLAGYMKAEGLRAGVPDVILPVPRGVYCGLAIEFKSKGGKVTPEQSTFIDGLRGEGWYVNVAYDTETAISFVQAYLEAPRETSGICRTGK